MSLKKFSVQSRKVLFSKGPIHLVDCRVRMPSGRVLSRQIIEHPGAVVVIPKISEDRYLLIRQFRFAARDWLWELPAGGIEPGESVRSAAGRELAEETGFRPGRLTKLFDFFPTPGISGEIMYLFLAENLKPSDAEGDDDEEIEIGSFTFARIMKMVRSGEIVDGKTLLAFHALNGPGPGSRRRRGKKKH